MDNPHTTYSRVFFLTKISKYRHDDDSVTFKRHGDVIKWEYCPHYWPFVRIFHRSPMNSLHKGRWRGALLFSLICAWINGWVYNREGGDFRRHRAHYDVIVMYKTTCESVLCQIKPCCRMGNKPFSTHRVPSVRLQEKNITRSTSFTSFKHISLA